MVVVEGLNGNKTLYKIVLYLVKIVPMLICGIYLLNTILSYYGIDWTGFSYIVQFLFIIGLYLLSVTFRFCAYHRMFIHYVFLTLVLNIIDYHWVIPLSNRGMFILYMIITGVFMFLALILHQQKVH